MDKAAWYAKALRNLGLISLLRLQLQKHFGSNQEFQTLTCRRLLYPVYARRGSSDLAVFHQIFVSHEYRCLAGLTNPKLILDCGANVGYSAAYFLSRFQAALSSPPSLIQKTLRCCSGISFPTTADTLSSKRQSGPAQICFVSTKHSRVPDRNGRGRSNRQMATLRIASRQSTSLVS